MFKRFGDYFVIITDNLMALDAISMYLFMLRKHYCIEPEVFPNVTLYRFNVLMPECMDDEVKRYILDDLEARHTKILKGTL